jgi:transposase
MEVLADRVGGLDVHKKQVTACVRTPAPGGGRREEVRMFATMLADLEALAAWLKSEGVDQVVMESTGSYWKPVWAVLEDTDSFDLVLVNARHVKQVPGRKTDVADAAWLAQLLEVGLLKGSFVPPPVIRELRDLTRYQKRLIQDRGREANRVAKVLEDAAIKLGSVASDILGVSGRAMIEALIGGERDPQQLAQLAKGKLRDKTPDLVKALHGRFGQHHAVLLRMHLDHIDHLDATIAALDERIDELMVPFAETRELLCTIPGVAERVANVIIAETGGDMTRFPTAGHLASWAGLCPGNNESAGKRKTGKTRPGDVWLTNALTQAAWAASRSKDNFLKTRYWRLARRAGKNKALIAVAHQILVIVWHMLTTNTAYQDLGSDWYHKQADPQQRINRLVRELQALGHEVTLTPAA